MNYKDVVNMISERIAQAIVLSHHLSEYDEPHANYVYEKTMTYPVLDNNLKDIFHQVNIILRSAFGIEICPSPYGC